MIYPPSRQFVSQSLSNAGAKIGEKAGASSAAIKSAGVSTAQKAGESGTILITSAAQKAGKIVAEESSQLVNYQSKPSLNQLVSQSLVNAGRKIGAKVEAANSALKSAGVAVAQKTGKAGFTIKNGIASTAEKNFKGNNQASQIVKYQNSKSKPSLFSQILSSAGGKIDETAAATNAALKSAGVTAVQKAGQAGATIKNRIATSVQKTGIIFRETGGNPSAKIIKDQTTMGSNILSLKGIQI